MRKNEHAVESGSANVFADLGFPDAPEQLAKASLAHEICLCIQREGLTQAKAGAKLGIDQPKVSALMHGKLNGFSTDRLFHFLNLLGRDVEVIVRPAVRKAPTVRVAVG